MNGVTSPHDEFSVNIWLRVVVVVVIVAVTVIAIVNVTRTQRITIANNLFFSQIHVYVCVLSVGAERMEAANNLIIIICV